VDADQVADVLGTAASAGVLFIVGLVVLRLAAPERFGAVQDTFRGSGPALGAMVAGLAMAGSLWFSEAAHFPPCDLCWYQRIAMYPLAVVLLVAALRRDPGIRPYGLVLAGLGLAVSAWHNVVETFPSVDASSCDPLNPCTIRWVEGLGFWTIPRMAFVGFALVFTALLIDRPLPEEP
jgi:disulfide bond formation protein DsbB